MYTAEAVTNSQGSLLSLADLSVEDLRSDNRKLKPVVWFKCKDEVGDTVIGDLFSDDRWSLIVTFIISHHRRTVLMRTPCVTYYSNSGCRKIEIDEFEYVVTKRKKISRKLIGFRGAQND